MKFSGENNYNVGIKNNLFLSNQDLDVLSKWKYRVVDNSITTKMLSPVWDWLVSFIPANCAPNVLTLSAFGCVLQAYWLVIVHGDEFPRATAVGAALLTYGYFTLDALDGKHARVTKNGSVLGELFDHGCDNLGAAFQVVTLLKILGWNDPNTQWYLVQAAQLVFLYQHIVPYNNPDRTIRFGLLSGPGEVLHITVGIMGLHGVVGRPFMWELYTKALRISEDYIIDLGLPKFNVLIDDSSHINAEAFLAKGMQLIYYFVVVFLIFVLTKMLFMNKVVFVDGVKKIVPAEGNRRSGRALLICLAIRIVPAVIMHHSHIVAYTQEQIISDGLFLSILTSDIIIAKVSDRPVHSLIIVMTMCSIMSNFSIYAFLLLYYGSVFGDISSHLNLPILNTVTNIYCDGVFDMLHRGHMEQFRKAHGSVAGGVRLFVGVVNDADATQYKRKPIMSEDERYAAVESCKYVHAVIRDSPTIHASSEIGEKKKTVTEQMIEDYHLHYFAVGKEYEVPKEGKVDYYECPRKLGMIKYTSRTEGVSTSTVIARIVERANELKD